MSDFFVYVSSVAAATTAKLKTPVSAKLILED